MADFILFQVINKGTGGVYLERGNKPEFAQAGLMSSPAPSVRRYPRNPGSFLDVAHGKTGD
jgi:hypothetical protein